MNPATLGGIAAVVTAIAALVVALRGNAPTETTNKSAQPATSDQITRGSNSPNISDVGGNVTVNIGNSEKPQTPPTLSGVSTIGYGSRIGMNVTVRQITGVNTNHAVLKAEHTEENAAEFCREYSYTAKESCIKDEINQNLSKVVTANCETGIFTTFYRRTLRYEGKTQRKSLMDGPEYNVYDIDEHRYLDGSMASGLDVDLEIFRTLCPKALRLGEIAYAYPVRK